MRYLFSMLLFFIGASAVSQVPTGVPQLFGGKFYEFRSYVLIDSLIMMPCGDTLKIPNKPSMVFNCADSAFYFWNMHRWNKMAKSSEAYWQVNGTVLAPKSSYYTKVSAPSTSNAGFSDWPYLTGVLTKSAMGVYGKEPSIDILIDSTSFLQAGNLTFRSNKLATGGLLDKFPRLPSAVFGANAYAVIQANAFQNGGPWTSTIEMYLGDSTGNNTNVPFAVSGPGNHFFGNRIYHTAEAKEALFFATAINRSSNFTFGSLNTFFAGNLNNLPAYLLNMPRLSSDTTTNKVLVRNPTTGAVNEMYWPTTGTGLTSLNALTASSQTFATGTSGSDFNISSVTSTHTFNIPDAGASARGLVTTGAQTLAGVKTFTGTSTIFGTTGQNANLSLRRTSDGAEMGAIGVISNNPFLNSLAGPWDIQTAGTTRLRVATNGVFVGGGSNAAARLEILAGATGANTGAFKMNLGSDLTTAVAGVFEYTTISSVNRLAFTPTGTTRMRFPLMNDVTPTAGGILQGNGSNFTLLALGTASQVLRVNSGATATEWFTGTITNTATLDFPSTAAGTSSDLTITVTGAADGDAVSIGVANGSTVANGCFTAWVSATNTVTIRFSNNDLVAALDPASGTFKATVLKF
jgi:hypothetical protein